MHAQVAKKINLYLITKKIQTKQIVREYDKCWQSRLTEDFEIYIFCYCYCSLFSYSQAMS